MNLPVAAGAVIREAETLLAGEWRLLGIDRTDMQDPDWFLDPRSGLHADSTSYAFAVACKDEERHGNVKNVWELSRHHHLTVLATAWRLTGDDRFAVAVARQLTSWWRLNPYLTGVNWTSGIEVGIRLINWVWVRRLLDGWPGAAELFEDNPHAVQQIWCHQRYLARFQSRGSSANNHVVAEAAGAVVAACGFDWFAESAGWRTRATDLLVRELTRNTFPDGINRELASGYQGLVTELGLLAAIESASWGECLPDPAHDVLLSMVDAMAAQVDCRLRPPRQGDGDDGRAWQVDAGTTGHWATVLDLASRVYGPATWWPRVPAGISGALGAALRSAGPAVGETRPTRPPADFPDAGVTILRTRDPSGHEVWVRCDGGPHGFLSIAAHAHADALSIEVRHDGVDVLADPGTYCYHGEKAWRSYFRSTLAHNTVEIGGRNQAISGGPFLWRTRPHTVRLTATPAGPGEQAWSAEHDGYADLPSPATHRRDVLLGTDGSLRVQDLIRSNADQSLRIAFHLGPDIHVTLTGSQAELMWMRAGEQRSAHLMLPSDVSWTTHTARTDPILGWFSPGFGLRRPATTLIGVGTTGRELTLVSQLTFIGSRSGLRQEAAVHATR